MIGLWRKRAVVPGFSNGPPKLGRRLFLGAALVAPAIIMTRGLLMPVKARADKIGWRFGAVPIMPSDDFPVAFSFDDVFYIDEFLDRVHTAILTGDGALPDVAPLVNDRLRVLLA